MSISALRTMRTHGIFSNPTKAFSKKVLREPIEHISAMPPNRTGMAPALRGRRNRWRTWNQKSWR